MTEARNNHYVPEWYQRGFLSRASNRLHYLDLTPDQKEIPGGRIVTMNSYFTWPVSRCFRQLDLYTTFFGPYINDEIERILFGEIDDAGSRAVRAFLSEEKREWHRNFTNFFEYIDAQKIRTPKGLDWIQSHYPDLEQNLLMQEMQAIRNMHCTIWTEGVREIVSAEESELKFILSDHPVTIYNYAIPPEDKGCAYPNDPPINIKASQTIFALDKDHCLILTNLEYASNPDNSNPIEKRTYAKHFRNNLVKTDDLVRTRKLSSDEVCQINLIIKARACRYIASSEKEALYPEEKVKAPWSELRGVLLPPEREVSQFGGEIYVGYKDGSTHHQDAFGRTTLGSDHLKKNKDRGEPRPNDYCGCGSGRKYKKCCRGKSEQERPSWDILSIRERNLTLYNGVIDILGLNKGKTWDDVRKELSEDQVKRIHQLYGFLWPPDTDIFSLLPRPDNRLKALYTGTLDPRVIGGLAISSSLYFEEVIIQHPFANPNNMKPEYSPVESPHQYKQQTLKDVFLLLEVMPFVEAGYINFIPDPCVLDGYLQKQMFAMAQERREMTHPHTKDNELFMRLAEDDFKRSILMLPEKSKRAKIKETYPNISEEKEEQLLGSFEQMKLDDPFALLQEGIFSKESGQITTIHLSPNFELSMYLAQITGSIVITDSEYRWNELMRLNTAADNYWEDLIAVIGEFEYFMLTNARDAIELRDAGRFSKLRNAFTELFYAIRTIDDRAEIESAVKRLKPRLVDAFGLAKKEIAREKREFLSSNMTCVSPSGGFVNTHVQRMLLTSGSHAHMGFVPAVIHMELA